MSKQLSPKSDILLENITIAVDAYRESKNLESIEKIRNYLMDTFDAQYAILWQYDAAKNTITALDKTELVLDVETSLIKNVIQEKKSQIENHIISHKAYKPKMDNPYAYHLKSMIIAPLLDEGMVKGILVLAKNRQQRRLFEREEIVKIEKFQMTLLPLIKEYQPKSLSIEVEEEVKKNIVEKQHFELTNHTLQKMQQELADDTTETVMIEENKTISNEIEQKDGKLHLEIIALKEEIAYLKAKDEVNSEIEQANKHYLYTIEKMTIAQNISEKQVDYLERKTKNLEDKMITLDEEKNRKPKVLQVSDISIDSLLMNTLPKLVRCEQIYILYEFIMYELQGSSSRVNEIEDKIKKSKILWELLEEPQYGRIVPINEALTNMTMFTTKLDMLQERFLTDKLKLEMIVHTNVPTVLKFDTEKVVNLCFHLMSDMARFINLDAPLNVSFDYIDNLLYIYIKGVKHESLNKLLNKKKFTTNLKNRTALAMSKKLIEILSVDLESYMEENYCIHQLVIPATQR